MAFALNGGFPLILADPPWPHDNEQSHKAARGGMPYKSVELERLASLPVADVAHKDCALFLWATWSKLREALYVMERWGFTYRTTPFVWVKLNPTGSVWRPEEPMIVMNGSHGNKGCVLTPKDIVLRGGIYSGMGSWTAMGSEFILMGKRGAPRRASTKVKQIQPAPVTGDDGWSDAPEEIFAPRGAHSAKPEIFRQRINELMGDVPGLELFARGERVPLWKKIGLEITGRDLAEDLDILCGRVPVAVTP